MLLTHSFFFLVLLLFFLSMKLQDGGKGIGWGKEVVATTSGSSGTSNDVTENTRCFADCERYLFSISSALKKIFEENARPF